MDGGKYEGHHLVLIGNLDCVATSINDPRGTNNPTNMRIMNPLFDSHGWPYISLESTCDIQLGEHLWLEYDHKDNYFTPVTALLAQLDVSLRDLKKCMLRALDLAHGRTAAVAIDVDVRIAKPVVSFSGFEIHTGERIITDTKITY